MIINLQSIDTDTKYDSDIDTSVVSVSNTMVRH